MKNPFIQYIKPYFDWLEFHFNNLAKQVIDNNISSGTIAKDFLSESSRRDKFKELLPEMFKKVNNFWKSEYKYIKNEINSLPGIKARFGGDIGPQVADSIFQSTGLYFDTIIVPDPLLRIANIPESISKINEYYFLKYAIEQLLVKEVYIADVYPPIAVLTADRELYEERDFSELGNLAKIDLILLTNDLYGENFKEYEESIEFYKSFSSSREAVTQIVKPDLLFLMEDVSRDPLAQLEAQLERDSLDWELEGIIESNDADYLPFLLQGRLMQINDLLNCSLVQSSHPLVSAPVSFHWLKWKLKSNQELVINEFETPKKLELGITNALLSENSRWLANVPLSALVDLRQTGKLSELRSIIRVEIDSLSNVKIDSLSQIVNQVDYNLSTALVNHQNRIKELDTKLRDELLISGPTFLASIAAAFQPSLFPFSPVWIQAIGGVLGTANLTEIVKSISGHIRERKKLSKTPVGILWSAKNK